MTRTLHRWFQPWNAVAIAIATSVLLDLADRSIRQGLNLIGMWATLLVFMGFGAYVCLIEGYLNNERICREILNGISLAAVLIFILVGCFAAIL